MKVYELIQRLMEYPAGADITCGVYKNGKQKTTGDLVSIDAGQMNPEDGGIIVLDFEESP